VSFFNFQPVNDIDRGREAVTYFHNASVGKGQYSETLDSLINIVSKGTPDIFLDSFGFAISSIELSTSNVEAAMENLASHAAGQIPRQEAFFSALSNQAQDFGIADWLPYVAKESAKDVVHGAAEVGNAVIDTGRSLLVIAPLAIVAAVLFIGYAKTRQIAGR
jgi:hypothetical protein